MKQTLLLMAVVTITAGSIETQSVTYNHNSPKQDQIAVVETGTGVLSPEPYYTLLRSKCRKSVTSRDKLSLRMLVSANPYDRTDEAETIDSVLVKHTEIRALNAANRRTDLAWLARGDEVDAGMERPQRNIDRILLAGDTTDDREWWMEHYHVYQYTISATKDAYVPSAQREKEYLRIYEDMIRQNEILVDFLARK